MFYLANKINAKAIIYIGNSELIVSWMSRVNNNIPIYVLSNEVKKLNYITLFKGIIPVFFEPYKFSNQNIDSKAINIMKKKGFTKKEDHIILIKSKNINLCDKLCNIKIVKIEN